MLGKTLHFLTSAIVMGMLLFGSAAATTIRVPTDQPTIQAGINAADAGDTVLVAPDTYDEHDIVMKSGVILLSESGPELTIIDANELGRVMSCENVDDGTTIEGFTIRGGRREIDSGAGIFCWLSSPNITRCIIRNNYAWMRGAGVYCDQFSEPTFVKVAFLDNEAHFYGGGLALTLNSAPELTDCTFSGNLASYGAAMHIDGVQTTAPVMTGTRFTGNSASYGGGLYVTQSVCTLMECLFSTNSASYGGAVYCLRSSPNLTRCTLGSNSAVNGAGVYCSGIESAPQLENTIIAFSIEGASVVCSENCSPTLTCCDIYGNAGGDWVGCIAAMLGVMGNISEDPLFCDDCYQLQACSPCVDGYGCGQIGAYGAGCPCGGGPSATDRSSWTEIKGQYRGR